MKFYKKLLSGVMALAMAASMAFAATVQAGAEKQKDGSHQFSMKAEYASWSFFYQNAFNFEWFNKNEIADFSKADAKGYMVAELRYYRDEKNYVQFNCKYNNGKWLLEEFLAKDSSIKKEVGVILSVGTSQGNGGEEQRFVFLTAMDNSLYRKYEKAPYKYWTIVSYDDNGNVVDEYSYGTNVPANDSKILAGMEKTNKDISKLSFSKISSQSYTGKECKPSVTVKDGKTKLTEGKDYTLTYNNNKDIGAATVTVKGKGDYTGEKTISFNIVPKKTALKVSKQSETKAQLSWTAVKGAEKYEIYCSKDGGKTYKKFKSVSGEETSYTSTKLDFKKYDYKFKIRSYGTSSDKKYYSSYSKVVTVK